MRFASRSGTRALDLNGSTSAITIALALALTAGFSQSQASAQDDAQVQVAQNEPAQPDPSQPTAPPADPAATPDESNEKIVVTGSRIRRNTFESVAPLQVIDGDTSRELGLVRADQMLQSLSVANGAQVDATVSSQFVTDNGPGSATIDLRGLDPERTLVLVNGRRLAPAGVQGAPTAGDLNLIPGSMIERIEVLLDGASSIYGSDAIAGVANVILRKDFDGLEIELSRDAALEAGGHGENQSGSLLWGVNSDRGFIGVGAEWSEKEPLRYVDRDFSKDCERHFEYDPATGQVFTVDPRRGFECYIAFSTGRVTTPSGGSLFYVPGSPFALNPTFNPYTIPDWVSSGRTGGVERVPLGGGSADYQLFPEGRFAHMEQGGQRWNVYSHGEYDLGLGDGITSFFELSHSNRQTKFDGGPTQLFQGFVPFDNPFNPFGFAGPVDGRVRPVVSVEGDRRYTQAEVAQSRLMTGVRGELAMMDDWFGMPNWEFEATAAYSRGVGTSSIEGIILERLRLSLETTTDIDPGPGVTLACGQDTDGDGLPGRDTNGDGVSDEFVEAVQCVPVNMFAPELLLGNNFATQAERDYLFGVRSFTTTTEQQLYDITFSGDLFDLPAGTVGMVLGGEYRKDELASDPDEIARTGALAGYIADAGATGAADILEFFGEVEVPILADMELAKELTVNASARFTEQQYYGSAWTYSIKALYAPTEWLKLRGTVGTSFRAPNLREFFLGGQTGFIDGNFDPCVVPDTATVPDGPDADTLPDYSAADDSRSAALLAACVADGVDPTRLGLDSVPSVQTITGGTTTLNAETSDAWSAGFVFDAPFFDETVVRFGITYFNIQIEDSIEEPTILFITSSCYDQGPPLTSAFCNRITRIGAAPDANFIDLIDESFINIGLLQNRGMDFNFLIQDDVRLFNDTFNVSLDISATRALENFIEILGDTDDDLGEIGLPEWRGLATAILGWDNFRALWRTQFIGEQVEDPLVTDAAFDTCPLVSPPNPNSTARDPACLTTRLQKKYVEDYFLHTAALTWEPDTWGITVGVRNVFNVDPEFVEHPGDSQLNTNGANVPTGVGYDTQGRTLFVNLRKAF